MIDIIEKSNYWVLKLEEMPKEGSDLELNLALNCAYEWRQLALSKKGDYDYGSLIDKVRSLTCEIFNDFKHDFFLCRTYLGTMRLIRYFTVHCKRTNYDEYWSPQLHMAEDFLALQESDSHSKEEYEAIRKRVLSFDGGSGLQDLELHIRGWGFNMNYL